MTNYEIATLILSGLAFILSIRALVISASANKISTSANTNSERQAKVSTLNNIVVNIDSARGRMEDHIAQMAPLACRADLSSSERAHRDILNSVLDSKIEGLLNAYDDACQCYLADNVDKVAFKGKYQHSIKELVEKYPEKFRDPVTRFRNIVRVYREWYP